jgi:hypothetical protein
MANDLDQKFRFRTEVAHDLRAPDPRALFSSGHKRALSLGCIGRLQSSTGCDVIEQVPRRAGRGGASANPDRT